MLEFAVEYCSALEVITGDHNLMLRSYELDDEEWDLVEKLCDVLEVSNAIFMQTFLILSVVLI